jgi:hypothetical protein
MHRLAPELDARLSIRIRPEDLATEKAMQHVQGGGHVSARSRQTTTNSRLPPARDPVFYMDVVPQHTPARNDAVMSSLELARP